MPANDEIINPNEHLEIPAWLNQEFFMDILKDDEPNFAQVLKFTPTAAIPPGENFVSLMIRIHMDLEMKDGSTKQKTYVLKTMLADDKGGKLIGELGLFEKEMKMYQTYIPAFEALYKAAGKNIQFAPKCLFTGYRDEHINFIFEDLKIKNFQNINRLEGLDMQHMKRALQKLAEFHAASAVYAEQNGPYPIEYQHSFIDKNKSMETQAITFKSRAKTYKKAMSMWGLEDAEKYIKKFPTFEQYWECALRSLDTASNTFNVLTHADFWSSNMMVNYKPDGALDQLLFLDYQLSKWGCPAEDLLFFITISAAKDIRIKEFDHFVEIYHEHLIESLKLLNYKKPLPKLRDLQKDMYSENTSFYAFFAVYNHLVVVLLPTDKDSNLHSLMRDDEIGENFRLRAMTSPLFVEAMKDLFPFYTRRGLFNFEDYN